jgi:hypothetical protein
MDVPNIDSAEYEGTQIWRSSSTNSKTDIAEIQVRTSQYIYQNKLESMLNARGVSGAGAN